MLVALDAGAEDIADRGRHLDASRASADADRRGARTRSRRPASRSSSSDLTMLPTPPVELDSAEAAKPVLRLIDALDDHDDVQDVYANFDIPESVLAELDA